MIKAVIFDVGGTLLGASDLIENIVAGNTDPKISRDDLYRQIVNEFFRQVSDCRAGSPFKKIVEIIHSSLGVVNQQFSNCLWSVSAAQVYWRTYVDDSFVINDADRVLEELAQRNVEMIIASDADAQVLHPQFEKYNWSRYFSKYVISSEVAAYKPDDLFVTAVKNAIRNYQKDEVIFVGDSEVDIQTGKKLGVRTALINKSKEKRFAEDHSIGSLLELLAL